MDEAQIEAMYDEWTQKIADSRTPEEFIAHFRDHVCDHFLRHAEKGKLSIDVWMLAVITFLDIFKKKFPHLTTADKLYKTWRHHVHFPGGAEPPDGIEDFLAQYHGPIKDFHIAKDARLAAHSL